MFGSLFDPVSTTSLEVPGPGGQPLSLATLSAVPDHPQGLVVFLHGLTGSKEDFVLAVPEMSQRGWAAVAWDHRGTFESSHLDSPGPEDYGVTALAGDAAVAIEHWSQTLRLPVHLVGHSFGGLVAQQVALASPERLASVTMLSSGPGGMGEQERLLVLCQLLESDLTLAEIFQRKLDLDGDDLPEFLAAFLRDRFVATDRAATLAMARAVMYAPDQISSLVGRLPAFVMYGEGDGSWPQDVQNEMAARLGVQPQVIPDAVHSAALENVDVTAQLIIDNALSITTPPITT